MRRALAVAFSAAIVLLVAAWFLVLWLLGSPSQAKTKPLETKDLLELLKLVFALVAGIGALVALVTAYRRQRVDEAAGERAERVQAHAEEIARDNAHDATERRVTELYGQAIDQLGHDRAAVRLGGLYSLVRLGQDHPQHRQTVIDVICAYLRMPFQPPSAPSEDTGDAAQELQVRVTAQRLLQHHLSARLPEQTGAGTYWGDIDIDLTGARLINFDFTNCRPRKTIFAGTYFSGYAAFDGVTFGGYAEFGEAKFEGSAQFSGATFRGDAMFGKTAFDDHAKFDGVTFGGVAWFDGALFNGIAGFGATTFSGYATFREATFYEVWFDATFSKEVRFDKATFGDTVWFGEATFGDEAWFEQVKFSWGVTFTESRFVGNAWFSKTKFDGESGFEGVRFSGYVGFSEAAFNGDVSFWEAKFSGDTWFRETRFSGKVNFGEAEFSNPPTFDKAVASRSSDIHVWPAPWRTEELPSNADMCRLVSQ